MLVGVSIPSILMFIFIVVRDYDSEVVVVQTREQFGRRKKSSGF